MSNAFIYNLTDTWNDGSTTFNALKINVTDTASAADSNLFDFQVGGVSQGSLDKNGNLTIAGNLIAPNISGAISSVDTISDLAARDVSGLTGGEVVSVTEDLRWGSFVWKSGDQSGNVSADPQRGVWVPPSSDSSGSSGSWLRIYDGVLYVDWFKEPSDTDDTASIQAAINFATDGEGVGAEFQRGSTVRLSRNNYVISSTIEVKNVDSLRGSIWTVIEGVGVPSISSAGPSYSSGGTTIRCDHLTGPGIRVKGGPVILRNFGVFANEYNDASTNISDANMTSGSATLTTTSSTPFEAGDVGKTILVDGAGSAGNALSTTIATFVSSSEVTLTASASTTVSDTNVLYGSGRHFQGFNSASDGILVEAEDGANSGDFVTGVTIQDVASVGHPGSGLALIGQVSSVNLYRVLCSYNRIHGIVADRGLYNDRVYKQLGGSVISDAAMTSGSAVLTSASGGFVSGDAGKRIMVRGAGPNGYDLDTTISTFDSATQVTLSAGASTTVSGAIAQYGGTWGRSGLVTADSCLTSDNGGHGIVLGHPASGFQNPFRWTIVNHESFGNCHAGTNNSFRSYIGRTRYSNHDSRFNCEQLTITGSAFAGYGTSDDRATARVNTVMLGGRSIKFLNNRLIFSVNQAVRIANTQTLRTGENEGDTQVSGAETADVRLEGVGVYGTCAIGVRIDDISDNLIEVKGIFGDYTTLYNAQRSNRVTLDNDGTMQYTGNLEILEGNAANPSFRFVADPDTGIYRATTNTLSIAAAGAQSCSFSDTAITPSVPLRPTINGTAAEPLYSFGTDTDTGFYRPAVNTINVSCGGTIMATFDNTTGLDIDNGGSLAMNGVLAIDPNSALEARLITVVNGQITNAAADINTTNKRIGKMVLNTTDNEVYVCIATGTTGAWKSLEDGTTITPA